MIFCAIALDKQTKQFIVLINICNTMKPKSMM